MIPGAFVGEWVEDGEEGTVGEVIAQHTGCDKQDPHAQLTKGSFTRVALLEQAIRVAASTLVREGGRVAEPEEL